MKVIANLDFQRILLYKSFEDHLFVQIFVKTFSLALKQENMLYFIVLIYTLHHHFVFNVCASSKFITTIHFTL